MLTQKAYARTTSNENELKNNTLATFVEEEQEENKEESAKMWRSVVTCLPVQIKPISKRSQHAIEDLELLEQEQLIQDPNGFHRQVLPNIRPIPKSKFLYKGLAYKEVKKIPGIMNENDDKHSAGSLKKPLVDCNLTQAYIRFEVNAERAKQTFRQPTILPTTTTSGNPSIKTPLLTKNQTSLDLREIRKRTVKGTTLPYRPTPQSASWTPARADNKSTIDPEVFLPIRGLSTLNNSHSISPLLLPSPLQQHATMHISPILSQDLNFAPLDNITNISLL